jgi:hypothetical protein
MKNSRPRRLGSLVTLGVLLAVAFALPTLPVASAQSSSTWTLKVLAPTPFEIVTGPYLTCWLQSSGFRMDARYAGTPDLATVGHVHEYLDGALIDMVPTSPDGYSTTDQISMVGVAVGLHYFTAIPAQNDHTVIASSAVTVPFYYAGPYLHPPGPYYFSSSPNISIVSPVPGATVQGGSFNLTVSVTNFVLSGVSFGKNLEDGVGHWHVFIDQLMMPSMKTMAFTDSQQVFLLEVPNGWHTFFAVLVNNQHMPFMTSSGMLEPGTYAMIMLYVDNT